MSTTTLKTITPEEFVFNTGKTRRDLLENLDVLIMLMNERDDRRKAYAELKEKIMYKKWDIDSCTNYLKNTRKRLEAAGVDVSKGLVMPAEQTDGGEKKRGSFLSRLFGGGMSAAERKRLEDLRDDQKYYIQYQQQLEETKQALAVLEPQLEPAAAAAAEAQSWKPMIEEWREKLGMSKCHSASVWDCRHHIASMRADTVEEADAIETLDHKRRSELGALNSEAQKKSELHEIGEKAAMAEMLMRGVAAADAQRALDDARTEAEEAVRKARNAALAEDYAWHEMVGDITDMETYGLLKLLDWEV